ncbi:hypothetical protein [Antrihabitans sp. YC2-6]|uniref:hypothetical protein n=1 Tax=Antrihabitans sp. YC2-6 TaxID=2799498 RepID=UPI0018F62A8B|nr:hypothetical protein [Antrihabitans sp. YC2-6]MBJ8345275.1 hypothetical protein [Antrihabitans sp. YC2-6]
MRALLGLLSGVLIFTAACSSEPSPGLAPVPTDLPSPCEKQDPPPAGHTDAPELFIVTITSGGWSPNQEVGPRLVVYTDRNAVERPDAVAQPTGAEAPAPPQAGYLAQCIVDQAILDVRELEQTDFGQPGITDQGSNVIEYRPASPSDPIRLDIYAPGETDGLTDAQLEAREKFTALQNLLLDGFVETGPATNAPSTSPGR